MRHTTIIMGISLLGSAHASALMIPWAATSLVDRAECIVEGHVASLTSRWTDDHATIITEVVLDATDVLLGNTNRVTFLCEGGVVGDLGLRVSDMPVLVKGEQVLVFLRSQTPQEAARDPTVRADRRCLALLGDGQGLYRIAVGQAVRDGFTTVGDTPNSDGAMDVVALKSLIRARLPRKHP